MDEFEKNTYLKALGLWGKEHQLEMLVEECCELVVAVKHYQRGRIPVSELEEELADVLIMLEQMGFVFSGITDKKFEKVLRLSKRIEQALMKNDVLCCAN